jgi:hypothetical protein
MKIKGKIAHFSMIFFFFPFCVIGRIFQWTFQFVNLEVENNNGKIMGFLVAFVRGRWDRKGFFVT